MPSSGYVLVDFGIPCVVVDSVEHAEQPIRALFENSLQPCAEFGCLNFFGVPRADGRQYVGSDYARLQKVDLSVELDAVGREQVPWEVREMHVQMPEQALVCDVVYRKQGPGVFEKRMIVKESFKEYGHEAGLPVIAMDDIGLQIERPA